MEKAVPSGKANKVDKQKDKQKEYHAETGFTKKANARDNGTCFLR